MHGRRPVRVGVSLHPGRRRQTGLSRRQLNAHQQAFVWDEEQGIRRVLDEVAACGLELPVDLELANAEFLSDDRSVVVGRPIDASTSSFWRVTLLD